MALPRSDRLPLLIAFAGAAVLVWSAQNDPFFWDTVQLASKHAHFFFENGLQWAVLPPEIDSGHPPFFGYYLACVWSLFGKILPAGHWAMLPFLWGIVWALYRLGKRLAGPGWAFWLLPLVLLDPVVAGQSVLVGPDLVLLCFFLINIEGVLAGKNRLVCLAALGLCAVSMRGMMTAGALFVWSAAQCWWPLFTTSAPAPEKGIRNVGCSGRAMLSLLAAYLPGFVLAGAFLWWHHAEAGWIGFHPDSPWAPAFERASGRVFLKNIAVLGWRWLDFGRVFEWLFAAGLFYRLWKKKEAAPNPGLLLLWLILLVFLSASALLYQNLSAHRYFLPGFVAFHLLVFQWFAQPAQPVLPLLSGRTGTLTALLVFLALGNFWIYPRGISMGWDSTLAHLPWHRLRADAMNWLETRQTDLRSVGTAFPNLNTGEHLMLNGDQRRMDTIDFSKNKLIFASNVFNDVSEAQYAVLSRDWTLLWRKKQAGVWIEIYGKDFKSKQ